MAKPKIKNHAEQNAHLPSFYSQTSCASFILGEKYYYSKEEKSHVEEAIIDVNRKRGGGGEQSWGQGSHQSTSLTQRWVQTSSCKKNRDMCKYAYPFVLRRKGRKREPDPLKGKNQGRSKAGVSCYLYLRGKLRALGKSFPQQHKSKEAILFYQPLIQRLDTSAITSQTSSHYLSQFLTESPQLRTSRKLIQMLINGQLLPILLSQVICFLGLLIHIYIYFISLFVINRSVDINA